MIAAEQVELGRRLSSRRRAKDAVFTAFLWGCAGLALLPLLLIVFYVIARGYSSLSVHFFTREPAGPIDPSSGGISEAFVGTGLIVGMAALFSIPLGILSAVYLSEYGHGRMAKIVRFVAEILLSTPSIVAGVFVSAVVVSAMHRFSALAGSIAITMLMWPVIARATEEILRLVPQDLREGALALGLPRWKMILRVVVPTAGAGIITSIMLALARGLGETAPILVTALGSDFMNTDPGRPTDALPLRIYGYARQPVEALHGFAWAAAIMLLVGVLLLSVTARILAARQQSRLG